MGLDQHPPAPAHPATESKVAAVLGSAAAWAEAFQGVPYPLPHFMLVFVGDREEEEVRAAAAAASCGFQRTMVLEGGLQALGGGTTQLPQPQADLRFIGRDALAVLLGMAPEVLHVPPVALIDVRRSDERALYGAINGAAHIPGARRAGWWAAAGVGAPRDGKVAASCRHPCLPSSRSLRPAPNAIPAVDQLPSALALSAEQFFVQYRFAKPAPDDLVVLSCESAAWPAVLHTACSLFMSIQDGSLHLLSPLCSVTQCMPAPAHSLAPSRPLPPRRPHQHACRVGGAGGARRGPAALPGTAAGRVRLAAGPGGEALPRLPAAGCAPRGGALHGGAAECGGRSPRAGRPAHPRHVK